MGAYYFATTVDATFAATVDRVKGALAEEGFGVLSEIDVSATLKKKLDADLPPYLILGACHPASALRAITAESRIGTLLPCNVIVRVDEAGAVEVAAVDPVASMASVANPALDEIAQQVRAALQRVVACL